MHNKGRFLKFRNTSDHQKQRLTCGTLGVLSCSGISSMTLFSRLAPLEDVLMPGMARPRICLAPGLRPPLVVLLEMLTLSASRATPEMRGESQMMWSAVTEAQRALRNKYFACREFVILRSAARKRWFGEVRMMIWMLSWMITYLEEQPPQLWSLAEARCCVQSAQPR